MGDSTRGEGGEKGEELGREREEMGNGSTTWAMWEDRMGREEVEKEGMVSATGRSNQVTIVGGGQNFFGEVESV